MKKVVKKTRLKRWVRVTLKVLLVLALGGLFYLLANVGANRYNDMYEECDNAKGYTCSYYEARQYAIRGE